MKDVEMLERGFTEERYIKRKPDRDYDRPEKPLSEVEKEIVKRLCRDYAMKTYSYTADSLGLIQPHERVPGSKRIPDAEQDGSIFFDRCINKFDKGRYDDITRQLMEDESLDKFDGLTVREFTLKNLFNEFYATSARQNLRRDLQDYYDSLKRPVLRESSDDVCEGEYYSESQSASSHLLEQLTKNGNAIENQEIKTLSAMLRGNAPLVNFFVLKYVEEMGPTHLENEFGEDYKFLAAKTVKIIKRMKKMYGKS